MMRILDIPYRTVKRGNEMRKALEEKGKGWVLLSTRPHRDSAAKHLDIIDEWWHSDEASCPDNQQKEQVRVYHGHGVNEQTGRRGYELHWRRVSSDRLEPQVAGVHRSGGYCSHQKADSRVPLGSGAGG
eukprot:6396790-Prymnesium_polylepis.1